jgi:hypothetical protein
MAKKVQFGGSFAPPLTAEKLASYKEQVGAFEEPYKGEVLKLIDMVETFQQTPASSNGSSPHPSGTGFITPLEDAEIKRIWDKVPWWYEVDALKTLFDKLPVGNLRNIAFHLLWFAQELTLDREPLTNDKL